MPETNKKHYTLKGWRITQMLCVLKLDIHTKGPVRPNLKEPVTAVCKRLKDIKME